MLQRLLTWGIRAYVKGPGRSWVYTSLALLGFRLIRRVVGRRPITETLSVKPGQSFTVEHLQISHRKQIRDIKRERRGTGRRIRAR